MTMCLISSIVVISTPNVIAPASKFCFSSLFQISQWMTDKRYIPLSPSDIAARLNLILRVHSLEQVENYFNNIPEQLKGFDVYTALLNCYAHVKSVEKAEAVMQKLRDMGVRTSLSYNVLMNLYFHMGSWEKLDTLMHEMEEKSIYCDNYTFTIRLSAYAATSDSEGIDKMVTRMESNPRITLDCNAYAIAADGYLKVGLVDKALEMLNKLEGLITATKKRNVAFDFLLKLYADTGKKDELYRIWNLYKKKERIYNKGYMSMISSLMKFNDIEGAEKIFKEWELRGLSYDFRIPNFLIDAYCRNGLLGKAEALLNKGMTEGGDPSVDTWYYFAGGYIEDNQVPKAVEALKKAILVCPPNRKPSKDTLATCLEYLEGRGDVEEAEEFTRILKAEGIFSSVVHDRLLGFIKDGK
uniref:Pentatricopeptide repeat-containing protein n=1 Tax=Davidia involucrata TaxID=16924 RepID=A0A5B7ATK0_DAVIN